MLKAIHYFTDVQDMSKLTRKEADLSITGNVVDFIYFGAAQKPNVSTPRIKFYGGATQSFKAIYPTMVFSSKGAGPIVGHERRNPYLGDSSKINQVRIFVSKVYPLLLLTWYKYLDPSNLLRYLKGNLSWMGLLREIIVPQDVKGIRYCEDIDQLNSFCLSHDLYTFKDARAKSPTFTLS